MIVTGLVGTTPITSANYFNHVVYVNGASSPGSAYGAGQTNFAAIIDGTGSRVSADSTWFSPNRADNTQVVSNVIGRAGAAELSFRGGNLEANDQLTGIRINFGQSITSVRVKIYGLV